MKKKVLFRIVNFTFSSLCDIFAYSCFKLKPINNLFERKAPRGFSALTRLYHFARPTRKTAMLRRLANATPCLKPDELALWDKLSLR